MLVHSFCPLVPTKNVPPTHLGQGARTKWWSSKSDCLLKQIVCKSKGQLICLWQFCKQENKQLRKSYKIFGHNREILGCTNFKLNFSVWVQTKQTYMLQRSDWSFYLSIIIIYFFFKTVMLKMTSAGEDDLFLLNIKK